MKQYSNVNSKSLLGFIAGVIFVSLVFYVLFFSALETPRPAPDLKLSDENSLGSTVENFRLLDHQGKSHELYYYTNASAIVLMVHGNGCPIVRNQIPALKKIRTLYEKKEVLFLLINSNIQDSRADIIEEASAFDIDFPILKDEDQLIGRSMRFERTSEVFVINPKENWRLVYRGPIDDRVAYETQLPQARNNYLKDVLNALLNGINIEYRQVQPKGCLINFVDRKPDVSYTQEIAPILIDKCIRCHRPDGIAPFAMSEYNTILGFAPMIREVIRTKRMPPWYADPHYGYFSNDMSLNSEERQKLVNWIEDGSPRGTGHDPLASTLKSQQDTWRMGEPDLVISLPPFDVPSTGMLPYRYIKIGHLINKDVWLRGIDFLIGNPKVVHHLLITGDNHLSAYNLIGTYLPGMNLPLLYPKGFAFHISANSDLTVQIHYATIGRKTTDLTKIGLYFSENPYQAKKLRSISMINDNFLIPPKTKNHTDFAQWTVERPIYIFSLLSHAHYRAKSTRFVATYPDGKKEILLSIPKYNFNWQTNYILKEPVYLPANSIVNYYTTWDNSHLNPSNPNPNAEVKWGLQSEDEMLMGIINYAYADEVNVKDDEK